MKKFAVIKFFLLITVLYSWSQDGKLVVPDSNNFVVIQFDTMRIKIWHLKNCTAFHLSDEEIKIVMNILNQQINDYNASESSIFKRGAINISNYKFQIIPVIDNMGGKLVWLNAFCDPLQFDWKQEVVSVGDGGNCYFNMVINLSTKEIKWFYVNGY